MIVFLSITLIAFLITTLCTPVAIKISHKTNFLDHPKEDPLKIHRIPTPLLGGLAILSGLLATFLMGVILFSTFKQEITGLVIALVILFVIGLVDDYKGLKPATRLLGHLSASLIVIFVSGVSVKCIPMPFLSIFITLLYLIGAINAMNLIDGLDGLASGITLVAAAGFLVGFILSENPLGMIIALGLIGSSIGFLIFNFPPARIFLGDNGSTVVGFLLGILAVLSSSKPGSITNALFPLLVLIVPILDTCVAISRRIINGLPLFSGDRDHVYDQLVRKGWSQRQTMLIMCLFGLLGSTAGIVLIAL